MKLFRSRPAPAPAAPVDPAAVIHGLETFIADLKAGYPLAVSMAGPLGEMPMDGADWSKYPADLYRLEQIAALGQPASA